jgi:hypothetical protein
MSTTAATSARTEEGQRPDDLHRLRDIVVEEVSLVDRAANKRRFLVVKRSDSMSGDMDESDVEKAKKKPAPEDEPTEEQKAKKPDPEDEPDETEKARRPTDEDPEEDDEAKPAKGCDGPEDEPKPRRKADLVLAPGLKESLLATLTQAMERLMALAKQIKAASKPDGEENGDALPDDLGSEIDGVVELLGKVTKGGKRKSAKAEVAKGGRMARDRLDRFQKALSLLSDILKELTGNKEQPAAPTAGAAEAGVQKREAQAGSPEVPGLTELVAGIGELTRVVKRQEDDLARIRQARGISNAIPVDGGGRRAEPQEVSWPLDMNRPISRDKVRKEVSFFDEV